MPGAPPSASASIPESSAIAGRPSAAAAARALPSAFAANVSPCSGGSVTPSGSGSSATPTSTRPSSRSLCSLRVASTSRKTHYLLVDSGRLRGAQPFDAVLGQRQQLVQVRARERRALGGRLHLDQPAVAGHDDVRVDLGGRVLAVVEVEQRDAVDDAARDRGDGAGERDRRELALGDEP